MAPKKATGAAAATTTKAKKTASGDSHPTYREMIKEAIITLKERNGSSRQSIKKYILNNKGVTDDKQFASQLNRALRSGVEKGEFAQPKGPSGPVKLAHKEPAKKASPPKDGAKKEAKPKTETKKKAATGTKKTAAKPAAKKAATTKKTTATKPKAKANTSSKRKTAPSTAAPAVVDKPTTLTKTKSGRVAKTTATPATKKAPAKKAAPKKAAAKKTEAKAEA